MIDEHTFLYNMSPGLFYNIKHKLVLLNPDALASVQIILHHIPTPSRIVRTGLKCIWIDKTPVTFSNNTDEEFIQDILKKLNEQLSPKF